jgi:hypothetical protein
VGVAVIVSDGVGLSIDVDSLEVGRVHVVVIVRPEESELIVSISVGLGPADLNLIIVDACSGGLVERGWASSENDGSVVIGGSDRLFETNSVII